MKALVFSLLVFAISACEPKTQRPSSELESPETLTPQMRKVDSENTESSLDELPVAKEWNAIWKSKDTLSALKEFKKRM